MNILISLFLLFAIFSISQNTASANTPGVIGTFNVIRDHVLTFSKINTVTQQPDNQIVLRKRDLDTAEGPFVLYLQSGNDSFVFDLDFNKNLFPAGVPEGADPKRHLTGKVRGYNDSSVFLTLFDGYYEGYFTYVNGTDVNGEAISTRMWVQKLSKPEVYLQMYNITDTERTELASQGPMMMIYKESELPTVDSDDKIGCGVDSSHMKFNKRDIGRIAREVHHITHGHKTMQKRDVTLLGSSGPWGGRTCLISVFADPLYYAQYGNMSTDAMISRIAIANEVFQAMYGVSLAVNNVYVLQSMSSKPWWTSSPSNINQFLNQFTSVANNNYLLWNFTNFCIGHAFTYQDFDANGADGAQPVGLAWVGNLCSAGPSSGSTGSFSVSTGKSLLLDPMAVQAYTISHEFGHNFGSDHDGNHTINGYDSSVMGQCVGGSNPWIMIAYSNPYSANGHTFSTCSRWLMETYMHQVYSGSVSTVSTFDNCFATQATLAHLSIQSTTANYSMPWYVYVDQCASVGSDSRVPYRSQPWTSCSNTYASTDLCQLRCTDPDSGECITFDISGLKYVQDGTVCGWNGTSYLVCMSGQCKADTYTVCDRRKDCCDPYGQYRPSSYRCRNTTDPTNVCHQDDFCNPSQVGDKALCPYTASPPYTGCNCKNKWSKIGCTGICGHNEMYGSCLNSSTYYNNLNTTYLSTWGLNMSSYNGSTVNNTCNNQTCTPPNYCLMLDGQPLCQNLTTNSCQLLCDNTVSNYSAWGWTCSCSASCTTNCCADYQSFCTNILPSSVFNVIPKLLIALYTCGICIAVLVGAWVTYKEHKEEKLRKELAKLKKSSALVARENYQRKHARAKAGELQKDDEAKSNAVSAAPKESGATETKRTSKFVKSS